MIRSAPKSSSAILIVANPKENAPNNPTATMVKTQVAITTSTTVCPLYRHSMSGKRTHRGRGGDSHLGFDHCRGWVVRGVFFWVRNNKNRGGGLGSRPNHGTKAGNLAGL